MASESPPEQPQGSAPDEPHHPAKSNLNFIWLYATIVAIFATSVTVMIMSLIFKKRRAKHRDPDLERQQLEPFQRWWYPWRYNKDGVKIIRTTAGGTGESPSSSTLRFQNIPLDDAVPPQLPAPAYHRDSRHLDGLVSNRSSNATDQTTRPASPALMTGALSPGGLGGQLPSPIQLETMEARLAGAGVATTIRDSASTTSLLSSPVLNPTTATAGGLLGTGGGGGKAQLPPVNPFTSKPFRVDTPRDDSDTTTPTRSRHDEAEHGYGYGGLPPLSPVEKTGFDTSRFNTSQFGRSLTSGATPSKTADQQQPEASGEMKSGVSGSDFANGYGFRTSTATTAPGKGDSVSGSGRRPAPPPPPGSASKLPRQPAKSTMKVLPSNLRSTPSRASSRHTPSSSTSSRIPSSTTRKAATPSSSSQASSYSQPQTPSSPSAPSRPSALGRSAKEIAERDARWGRELYEKRAAEEAERACKAAEEKEAKEAKKKEKKGKGGGGLGALVGGVKKVVK